MPAAYKFFAELAQTWGLLYFVAVFLEEGLGPFAKFIPGFGAAIG